MSGVRRRMSIRLIHIRAAKMVILRDVERDLRKRCKARENKDDDERGTEETRIWVWAETGRR